MSHSTKLIGLIVNVIYILNTNIYVSLSLSYIYIYIHLPKIKISSKTTLDRVYLIKKKTVNTRETK